MRNKLFQLNRLSTFNQNGFIALLSLIFLGIISLAAAALFSYTTLNLRGGKILYAQNQATFLAEAGIEKAIDQLNQDSSFTGESGSLAGVGEFIVTVSSISSNHKQLISTGYMPNSTNPVHTKTIKADVAIDNAQIAFNYGVQVGEGGLIMDNNSIINGNIFSNGNITGGSAVITGSVVVAQGTAEVTDQEWTVQNQNFQFGHTSSVRDVAQSFKPSITDKLNNIQVLIRKVSTPGDLTVRIITDNNGSPSKTALASATIKASLVTGAYGWIPASFATPPALTAGTTYWIMLSVSSVNSSRYYFWGSDSNQGYGNGVGKYSTNWNASAPVWTLIAGDLNYRTFMGGAITFFDGNISVGPGLQATEIRRCGGVSGTAQYVSVFTNCSAASASPNSIIPGPQTMPISQAQIEEWEQAAESGGVIAGPHTISGTQNLGPIKIDGNLTLSNGSTLYLTGPVWVKGNIVMNNNTSVIVHSSLGNSGTVLLADNPSNPSSSGIVTVSNNTIIAGNGNPNSFPLVLTTSANQTGAMYINNNSAGAIYYASNGSIEVANNAGGNQMTGYKIRLSNNATVNYTQGLQDANFSNGPGGSWTFSPGSYVILGK